MKYAVITGAYGGLGNAACKSLRDSGFTVFATDINLGEKEERIIPIYMDITSEESVSKAFKEIATYTKTIDVVVNCAGVITLGSMVEKDAKVLERVLQIGLLGMYRVNKAAFPFLKDVKGKIINISSEYGVLDAIPLHSFYGILKHAVETYNEGLRRELQNFNIKVIVVRPGAFKTPMQDSITTIFTDLVNETNLFEKPLHKMEKLMVGELNKAKDPEYFGKLILKISLKSKPKKIYRIHNSFKMKLLSALPRSMQDWIFRLFFK